MEAASRTGAGDEDRQLNSNLSLSLSPLEIKQLASVIASHHTYSPNQKQCSSLLTQRTTATPDAIWSIVCHFECPQIYKHFIRSCTVKDNNIGIGTIREVSVISGLPASTSSERLDVLDDENRIFGFSIIGGEHRLKNYRSITTVNEITDDAGKLWTVVLESYIVDVPEGNTVDDTRFFADYVVKLNLQKLASVAESPPPSDK
ncbi:Abscisic acid receptor PYR1 [Zostera marina]|uniref:Abscisic acid receptor PYR1 n=1 Tax=Zostera marina TaxID=29655 RepID=A0A0K9NYX2_ZOSMR|nr:Abscisic acid receptor PYR1 [Zostera marina]